VAVLTKAQAIFVLPVIAALLYWRWLPYAGACWRPRRWQEE
jgi:hypothetical protein